VIAGVVAALATGGGGSSGDKVLAAGETNVHGIHYRVVASTSSSEGPKQGAVPLYFNEYVGSPAELVQRFVVPNAKFYRDSVVANLKVHANPDPNPDKTAGIVFSWFHHAGDQTDETKRYVVTQHGIQLY